MGRCHCCNGNHTESLLSSTECTIGMVERTISGDRLLWSYGSMELGSLDVNVWAGIGVTYYRLLHERQRNINLVHVTHTDHWP